MAASETFHSSPLSATVQNSMDRKTRAQEHHGTGGFSRSKLYQLSAFSLVFHCIGQSFDAPHFIVIVTGGCM